MSETEQSKMDIAQEKMNALCDYLHKECGLDKEQIIHTLALMNEYDSAFQDAIEDDVQELREEEQEQSYIYRNEQEDERYERS